VPRAAYERSWGPLVFGAAAGLMLVLALASLAGARRGKRLRTRLAAHVDARGRARRRGRATAGAAAALMLATESAFSASRLWRHIHRLLERADVPLRTVEFVYIAIGSSFVFALLTTLLGLSAFAVVLSFGIGAFAPFGYLHFKARRRGKAFEDQLPDLLLTIASSLKAGHSFKQGLQSVADESEDPAAKEFQRVLSEIRLGRPVEDALTEVAERVSSKNLEFVVTAVTIQSQVGGSLAGLFDMVADAVRTRQQFARKIRGLTAMGRASAYVLLGLPFALVGMIMVVSPDYLDPLFGTGAGKTMVALGLTMMAIGSVILKKIVSFRG
jgi:tight adherence protein B